MKALVCNNYGPIDQLEFKNPPDPIPLEDEVVIDVAYSSINFPDTLIVQGLYQVKPQVPFIPGHECSGVVSATGSNVTNFAIGDRVTISKRGIGCFAEKVAGKADFNVRKVAEGVDLKTAAVLSLAYHTSLHGLVDCAKLSPSQTVLVLGASGGTGMAAIEIAKAIGATVIAAASTDEKLDFCKTLGADHVINYNTEDLKDRVKAITQGRGADVVFDPVGDKYTEPAFRSLGFNGKLLVVGFAGGEIPHIPLNLALLSERIIMGVYLGPWAQMNNKGMQKNQVLLNGWIKAGKINPKITKSYKFDEIKDALEFASTRQIMGKVLVEINPNLG
jgi:NADPH2:quinone reductase